MKEKKTIKIKATAKIEEFKQWVYKHFVGVYIAIGVAICLVMFLLGALVGHAIAKPAEVAVSDTYSDATADTSVYVSSTRGVDLELVLRGYEDD